MKKMIIAVPAWGKYRRLFLGPVLASHRAAIARLRNEFRDAVEVKYVVLTDDSAVVARHLADFDLTLVKMPTNIDSPYPVMNMAHERGIEVAGNGDRVILTNADMILSTEALVAVERSMRQGYRAVVCGGARTSLGPLTRPPRPQGAESLAAWCMAHPHPITQSCFWGSGRTNAPWTIFFREENNVVMRGFHLHPLAVVKDRNLPFFGSCDLNLIDNYRFNEIKLLTDRELAFAEISSKAKTHPCNDFIFDVGQIVAWALRGARPMHWWNFRHRIAIVGNPDSVTIDGPVADAVMRLCPYREAVEAPI